MDHGLAGKTALVTGASRGIGKEIARILARNGANVMLTSRKIDSLEATAADIHESESCEPVAVLAGNAGDMDFAEKCVAETKTKFGSVDILVNNAATNPYFGPIFDIPRAAAQKTLDVGYLGLLGWSQLAWHAGLKDNGGTIVNIASTGGFCTDPGIAFYNSMKAAVVHLTRQMALEMSPGVRVNAIAPGLIKTDMARQLWEKEEPRLADAMPLKRLGEPEDIANAALFLVSNMSSYMTGQTILVDGGALIRPPLG